MTFLEIGHSSDVTVEDLLSIFKYFVTKAFCSKFKAVQNSFKIKVTGRFAKNGKSNDFRKKLEATSEVNDKKLGQNKKNW